MKRMKFHHHKLALTLTILLVSIIGVIIGVHLENAAQGMSALPILLFGFLMVNLVVSFITISVVLRTREELHELHKESKRKKK